MTKEEIQQNIISRERSIKSHQSNMGSEIFVSLSTPRQFMVPAILGSPEDIKKIQSFMSSMADSRRLEIIFQYRKENAQDKIKLEKL